jgi:hypothetical protein
MHRLTPLLAAALLASGCVPVTEPVGDVEKAKPDEPLVGKWSPSKGGAIVSVFDIKSLAVDAPAVKGNPRGLMRAVWAGDGQEDELWFFPASVGKNTYVNAILGPADGVAAPDFGKEGGFAKWQKQEQKRYFVFRYTRDGDALTLDCGNADTFSKLMKAEGIRDDGAKSLPFFYTPAGWLAKYLDKTGPQKVFDGTNVLKLKRAK